MRYCSGNDDFLLIYSKLPYFARHIVDECYDLEKSTGQLANYFDYEAFGRELFMWDYSMGANGNVLRCV